MPNVEVSISNGGWGGDFSVDATGDLVLATDILNAPTATQQRIYRLLMTNPRFFDANNNPISFPGDLFASTYGSGIRALVGQMITPQLTALIQTQIVNALMSDPTIARSPAPVVTVTNVGSNTIQVSLTCTAVTGEVVTIPSFNLSTLGG
jgi:hypothetical protein